jgi:antibiotic biosynthesis monooxygenase (ABM) superfamily enzyme
MQAMVRKEGMIKGIVEYNVLDHKSVEPILMQLRSFAMQYPGFVDAEFLVSEGDQSVGVMISTWEKVENWQAWAESKGTITLLGRTRTVVTGTPRLTAYRVIPTGERR